MFKIIQAFFLALFSYLKPGNNLFIVLAVLALLGLLAVIYPAMAMLWPLLSLVIGILLVWDASRLYAIESLQIEREAPGKMSLGLWHEVHLTVHFKAGRLGKKQLDIQLQQEQ